MTKNVTGNTTKFVKLDFRMKFVIVLASLIYLYNLMPLHNYYNHGFVIIIKIA